MILWGKSATRFLQEVNENNKHNAKKEKFLKQCDEFYQTSLNNSKRSK